MDMDNEKVRSLLTALAQVLPENSDDLDFISNNTISFEWLILGIQKRIVHTATCLRDFSKSAATQYSEEIYRLDLKKGFVSIDGCMFKKENTGMVRTKLLRRCGLTDAEAKAFHTQLHRGNVSLQLLRRIACADACPTHLKETLERILTKTDSSESG